MGQQGSKSSSEPAGVVEALQSAPAAATGAVKDTAGTVVEVVSAVGAEDRAAIRLEQKEQWGRVEDGDTFWDLSEKYLGDATEWETLRTACRRELGTDDPLLLLPGSHVSESCVARAQAQLLQKR